MGVWWGDGNPLNQHLPLIGEGDNNVAEIGKILYKKVQYYYKLFQ